MRILKGHISPETAYVVDDYPYGYRLRCKIRYWLEHDPRRGVRFVSQTTNPKASGEAWNKPKPSTYSRFGGCMILIEAGHIEWRGLTEYCNGAEAKAYSDTYGEGVPESAQPLLRKWVAAKLAYDAAKNSDKSLAIGLPEARAAFRDTE